MVYFPSMSVTTPTVVPFTMTAAPREGSPEDASVTVPDTEMLCAETVADHRTDVRSISILLSLVKFIKHRFDFSVASRESAMLMTTGTRP